VSQISSIYRDRIHPASIIPIHCDIDNQFTMPMVGVVDSASNIVRQRGIHCVRQRARIVSIRKVPPISTRYGQLEIHENRPTPTIADISMILHSALRHRLPILNAEDITSNESSRFGTEIDEPFSLCRKCPTFSEFDDETDLVHPPKRPVDTFEVKI